jgi:hypothetical protein
MSTRARLSSSVARRPSRLLLVSPARRQPANRRRQLAPAGYGDDNDELGAEQAVQP